MGPNGDMELVRSSKASGNDQSIAVPDVTAVGEVPVGGVLHGDNKQSSIASVSGEQA